MRARARRQVWPATHRPRGLPMRLRRFPSSTLPPFPRSRPLRAPDRTLAPRARALPPLPSPPTAPEAARGVTCVRLSLAGIATLLPGLGAFDRITNLIAPFRVVFKLLFPGFTLPVGLHLVFVILLCSAFNDHGIWSSVLQENFFRG